MLYRKKIAAIYDSYSMYDEYTKEFKELYGFTDEADAADARPSENPDTDEPAETADSCTEEVKEKFEIPPEESVEAPPPPCEDEETGVGGSPLTRTEPKAGAFARFRNYLIAGIFDASVK